MDYSLVIPGFVLIRLSSLPHLQAMETKLKTYREHGQPVPQRQRSTQQPAHPALAGLACLSLDAE